MRKLNYCILTIILLLITSCGEDRSGEYYALTAPNKWIETTMRDIYLWYEDIPAENKLSFLNKSETFFSNLLSTKSQDGKGDKYSYIEILSDQTKAISSESTYGFDFTIYQSTTSKQRYARVLYVLPNSPASEAGIKRGDWISKVGEKTLTGSNSEVLISGKATTFTLANAKVDPVSKVLVWEDHKTPISISASRKVENNPFYVYSALTWEGRKVGYLLYNNFSTGPNDTPEENTYNDKMRNVFNFFKSAQVEEFILDLRYNPGGYLSCAQVLGSLLVKSEEFNEPFCSLIFNNKHTDENSTLNFESSLTGGNNLGLDKLYVITSAQTASASEAIINCLAPYMEVITIGVTTEGKNVASRAFSTNEYQDFILHPIIATVANMRGESDYYKGIKPKYALDELDFVETFYPLGDPEETMYKNALSVITTGKLISTIEEEKKKEEEEKEKEQEKEEEIEQSEKARLFSSTMKPVYSSINNKKTKGIKIDNLK